MKKRLGILLCDEHHPDSIKSFGTYDNDYKMMIDRVMPGQWGYAVWRCYEGSFPSSVDQCDAWIISGSKSSAYDSEPWIHKLKRLIIKLADSDALLVGICFGHQIIHQSLGGRVQKFPGGWGLGAYPVKALSDFGCFKSGSIIRILAVHQDQVSQLAPGFSVLAASDFCENAITRRGTSILTWQAHPEFVDGFFVDVCARLRTMVDDDLIDKALGEVGLPDDRNQAGKVIVHFLAGKGLG
ncbi:type 1 glutamine amidotransferase [Endozoicomonas atrinae]|uniref:type 1 glutamine amidotransferase n=1 Tax=Endozoicomonas atrinae TaxID=1333660 RepID=UPI000B275D28|nr:type 1 glutamine amidotransferase [Endozoicomonas atrinae]